MNPWQDVDVNLDDMNQSDCIIEKEDRVNYRLVLPRPYGDEGYSLGVRLRLIGGRKNSKIRDVKINFECPEKDAATMPSPALKSSSKTGACNHELCPSI